MRRLPRLPRLPRLRAILSVTGVLVFALQACVVKLADRNSPEVNGGVTGAAVNCKGQQVLGKGAPGGAAEIKYVGRFKFPEKQEPDGPPPAPGPEFDWSGSSITVRFEGTTSVTAKLLLQGQVPQDMMFTFVVDDFAPQVRQITVKKDPKGAPTNEPEEEYTVDKLAPGPHELTIWKNTEAQKGSIVFKGFDLHGGKMLPPTRRPRRMEVIGDSIICGYGNMGANATCPFEVTIRKAQLPDGKLVPVTVPLTENQFLSFTSQAARELDADIVTICWSGKGVYKNYKDAVKPDPTGLLVLAPDAKTAMPELWLTRTLATELEGTPWDFTKEKPEEIPQVVFISLGTNDFARDTQPEHPEDPTLLPGNNIPDGDMNHPEELEKFFQAYLTLVTNVRQRRPEAHIFVATPPMLTDQFPLDNARKSVRNQLNRIVQARAGAGDNRVYAMDLVEMGFRYGLGCDYHPNLEVHQIMAEQLVGAIRSKTCW